LSLKLKYLKPHCQRLRSQTSLSAHVNLKVATVTAIVKATDPRVVLVAETDLEGRVDRVVLVSLAVQVALTLVNLAHAERQPAKHSDFVAAGNITCC
jgi:hypothetical protein